MSYRELANTANILKDELRNRSKIFAIEAKEAAAKAFRLPSDFYYYYSYEEWNEASKRHRFLLDEMHREIKKYEKWEDPAILETVGNGRPIEDVPFSKWTARFLIYRAQKKKPIAPYISKES